VSAILELVAEGHGYAVLSPRALDGADVARRLVSRPIVRPHLASTLAIATSAQRPSTPLQQATVELIEGAARSMMSSKPGIRRQPHGVPV
jgi:LysR family nitrogen assimilation transcriptional regulator